MSEKSVQLLFESKSTLNVLNNLLRAALDTVLMAKTTGKTYNSIFENSKSGVQLLDKNNAIIHNHAFNLKELRHALFVVLTLTGSGFIGHYAYKNREDIKTSITTKYSQITEKHKEIKKHVSQLTLKGVIEALGRQAVQLLTLFPNQFNNLGLLTNFNRIRNFIFRPQQQPDSDLKPTGTMEVQQVDETARRE
jgi:hypothetical protein